MVNEAIRRLVEYGLDRKLIHPADAIYVRNQLLMVLHLDDYEEPETVRPRQLHELLEILTEDAVHRGVCQDNSTARELFDTRLMGCLTARPSEVRWMFREKYAITRENVDEILRKEIGLVFAQVLENAGVYKLTPSGREGFARFLSCVR